MLSEYRGAEGPTENNGQPGWCGMKWQLGRLYSFQVVRGRFGLAHERSATSSSTSVQCDA